ncbi:MAG: hypothetical protein IJ035_01380 [Oscillospiraceae bacterium]|nr:hypothetical protein [Oscillospiraceae bacterium]
MDIHQVVAKVCSVVISIILAAAAVVAEFIGLLLISPYSFLDSGSSINGYDFIFGILVIAAAFIIPIAINRRLYRVWYSEEELSEKWVKIPNTVIRIITTGLFIYFMLFCNYFWGLLNADWYWYQEIFV